MRSASPGTRTQLNEAEYGATQRIAHVVSSKTLALTAGTAVLAMSTWFCATAVIVPIAAAFGIPDEARHLCRAVWIRCRSRRKCRDRSRSHAYRALRAAVSYRCGASARVSALAKTAHRMVSAKARRCYGYRRRRVDARFVFAASFRRECAVARIRIS